MKSKNKKQLPQLNLFEEILLIEDLQEDDHFRIAVDSPNIYFVREQFFEIKAETKAVLTVKPYSIYFIPHGRKVFKILTACNDTEKDHIHCNKK